MTATSGTGRSSPSTGRSYWHAITRIRHGAHKVEPHGSREHMEPKGTREAAGDHQEVFWH